jgi:hypothetical protein
MTDREPVGQALNYVLSTLKTVAEMALEEESYAEVAAEEIRIGQILNMAQLILSFLKLPTNKVGRQN